MRSRFARLSLSMASTTLLLLCSCSKKPEANLVSGGSPVADSIRFEYAVYMLPAHVKDPMAVLREALAKQYANLKLIGEIPKQPREMVVSARIKKHVQQEYAPPDMQYLRSFGYGLSQKQAQDLQKSEEAFVLQFSHPQEMFGPGCAIPMRSSKRLPEIRTVWCGMNKLGKSSRPMLGMRGD